MSWIRTATLFSSSTEDVPIASRLPIAEERELADRKMKIAARRHEAYLRSKKTGWQATYYWKKKREKKEKMDAMKEKLRAEDRAKGIYYLPNQKTSENVPQTELKQ